LQPFISFDEGGDFFLQLGYHGTECFTRKGLVIEGNSYDPNFRLCQVKVVDKAVIPSGGFLEALNLNRGLVTNFVDLDSGKTRRLRGLSLNPADWTGLRRCGGRSSLTGGRRLTDGTG
jgi:hypothetical protein